MSHGPFYRCPYYLSGPGNIAVALLFMEGQRALRFYQNYLNLCSEDERRSYGFGTTWGWVINDRLFIFRWTNPLNYGTASEHLKYSSKTLWCFIMILCLLWGLTITQNSIAMHNIEFRSSRLTENASFGADTDTEYRINASLITI